MNVGSSYYILFQPPKKKLNPASKHPVKRGCISMHATHHTILLSLNGYDREQKNQIKMKDNIRADNI